MQLSNNFLQCSSSLHSVSCSNAVGIALVRHGHWISTQDTIESYKDHCYTTINASLAQVPVTTKLFPHLHVAFPGPWELEKKKIFVLTLFAKHFSRWLTWFHGKNSFIDLTLFSYSNPRPWPLSFRLMRSHGIRYVPIFIVSHDFLTLPSSAQILYGWASHALQYCVFGLLWMRVMHSRGQVRIWKANRLDMRYSQLQLLWEVW